MYRIIISGVILLFITSVANAQSSSTLSALPSGSSVSGTDLFYDVQTPGVGGVKVTATQIAAFTNKSSTFDTSFCSTIGAALIRQTAGWMCSTAGGTDGIGFGVSALNTSQYDIAYSTGLGTYVQGTTALTSPFDWRWTYSGAAPSTGTYQGANFYTTAAPSTSVDDHNGSYNGVSGTVYSASTTVLQGMVGGRFTALRVNTGGGGSTNPIFGVTGTAVMGDQASSQVSGDGAVGGLFTALPNSSQAQSSSNVFDPVIIAAQAGLIGRTMIANNLTGTESTYDNVGVAGYVSVDSNATNVYSGWFKTASLSHTMALAVNNYGIYVNDVSGAKNLNMAVRTGAGTVQLGGDLVPGANVVGQIIINQLATPVISSVQSGCNGQQSCAGGGSKTYTYEVVAVLSGSVASAGSATVSTSTGFDDLSQANQANLITWAPVEGAVGGYNIYRTVTTGSVTNTTGKIANVPQNVFPVTGTNALAPTTPSYADIGAAGDSTSPPTSNTTGNLASGGNITCGAANLPGAGCTINSGTNDQLNITANTNTLKLGVNGGTQWEIVSGNLLAVTDNTDDIGATGATRPRNLYLSGTAFAQGIASDATHTDRTVCEDTTTNQFLSGSGTAGICLGTSSLAFKHDVRPLNVGLQQIMGLQPIEYRYNPGYGDPDKDLYGFSAEQGRTVLPKLASEYSFDYLGVVPVLVKALQEQQVEIDELKRRIQDTNKSDQTKSIDGK